MTKRVVRTGKRLGKDGYGWEGGERDVKGVRKEKEVMLCEGSGKKEKGR